MQKRTELKIEEIIKNIWSRLTDDELAARTERRDEFFMAVKKKHGVARAQAQMFLYNLEHQACEAVA